jgi:energy-coupling factor transporter ATP-binding protein EcfA2
VPKLSVSNYRCFNREKPARFSLEPGFTALVGPNNAGKSSLLRFFYEMRGVLSEAAGSLGQTNGLGSSPQVLGVDDPTAIFCNSNDGDIQISIELPELPVGEAPRVRVSSSRKSAGAWMFRPEWPTTVPPSDYITRASQCLLPLADTLYIGPFRNILNAGGQLSYYDIAIGTDFIRTWDIGKNGANKQQARRIRDVENDIRRIFGFNQLAINPSEDRTTLQVFVDEQPYRLAELGSGLAQFIFVFASAAVRRPGYILIDEPELSLHPSLQIDFLLSLAKYSRSGVLFSTHSIGLARSVAERIYSLRPTESGVEFKPLERTTDYVEFLGEMSFSTFRELGFRRVLLVEGVSEVKVVQAFLRLYRKEHQVVVLPLGGSQLINGRVEMELSEIRRITKQVSVLIDSERSAAGATISKDRQEFLDICGKLEFNSSATAFRATENYFSEQAIRLAFGGERRALEPFELLSSHPNGWAKSDNWRIASHMTRGELEATDLGPFFASL